MTVSTLGSSTVNNAQTTAGNSGTKVVVRGGNRSSGSGGGGNGGAKEDGEGGNDGDDDCADFEILGESPRGTLDSSTKPDGSSTKGSGNGGGSGISGTSHHFSGSLRQMDSFKGGPSTIVKAEYDDLYLPAAIDARGNGEESSSPSSSRHSLAKVRIVHPLPLHPFPFPPTCSFYVGYFVVIGLLLLCINPIKYHT